MTEVKYEDLISRLDLIQQGVWNTEESMIKYLSNISKLKVDIDEIKSFLEFLSEKVDKLDNEIRGLRENNGE